MTDEANRPLEAPEGFRQGGVFFAWVDSLGGPEAQLWFGDKAEARGTVAVLFKHQLTEDDRGETFDSLQKKYPRPKPGRNGARP